MKIAYIDSSYFIAVIFGENNSTQYSKFISRFDNVVSSVLLEAEVLSTAKREQLPLQEVENLLSVVRFLHIEGSLRPYLRKVFECGYLRGADAFHVASALWCSEARTTDMHFLTLDKNQASIADILGFKIYP